MSANRVQVGFDRRWLLFQIAVQNLCDSIASLDLFVDPIVPDQEPEKRGEAALANLGRALNAEQFERFQQLHCQLEGPVALGFARYASAIGLDAGQRSKIRTLTAKYRERSRPFHQAIFTARREEDVPAFGRRLLELSHELDERILTELTDEQRDRWVRWLGKKCDWNEENSAGTGEQTHAAQ